MKKSIIKFAGFVLTAILAIGLTGCAQPSGGSTGYTATYQFTESVRTLPAGTDGTAGTSAIYVEFGDWPQTVAAEDIKFNATPESNGWYIGSDGNYYVKCKENAFGTGVEYKYTDETQAGQGGKTTRYFKVEPIKWRVLTDNYSGKKLLLAENILTGNVAYYDNGQNRTIGGKTVYPNNYQESQIRAYLNGLSYYYYNTKTSNTEIKSNYDGKGFLQTAFTSSAQSLIAVTQVDNSLASTGNSSNEYVCDPTEDKIFLLSYKEAFNDGYFTANTKRIRKPTDYAKANYAWQDSDARYGGYWWLRSPSSSYSYARNVSSVGSDYNYSVYSTYFGVVPALSISF